jgi:hypothetical protein
VGYIERIEAAILYWTGVGVLFLGLGVPCTVLSRLLLFLGLGVLFFFFLFLIIRPLQLITLQFQNRLIMTMRMGLLLVLDT